MPQAAILKFVLESGARAFTATIGGDCLSTELATIAVDERVITVEDAPACAAEIKTIAENWLIFADLEVVSLNGSPEALTMVRERLEEKFGQSPNASLRFLAPTQNCRCLVMVGRKAMAASDLAAPLLPRKALARPSVRRAHDESRVATDLIWRIESQSPAQPADDKLVN